MDWISYRIAHGRPARTRHVDPTAHITVGSAPLVANYGWILPTEGGQRSYMRLDLVQCSNKRSLMIRSLLALPLYRQQPRAQPFAGFHLYSLKWAHTGCPTWNAYAWLKATMRIT